jgi:EpsI family protein
MTSELKQAILFAVFLCLVALAALLVSPKHLMAADLGPISLATEVPTEFGDWTPDVGSNRIVDPVGAEASTTVYSQTLSRTYMNSLGDRVMLSIAYGDNQRLTKLHIPEGCYVSQGFHIAKVKDTSVDLSKGEIAVREFEATMGDARVESVTYWIIYGDRVASKGLSGRRTLYELELGGKIPDGLVIRVSSIGRNVEKQFATQRGFLEALSMALSQPARLRLFRFTS